MSFSNFYVLQWKTLIFFTSMLKSKMNQKQRKQKNSTDFHSIDYKNCSVAGKVLRPKTYAAESLKTVGMLAW